MANSPYGEHGDLGSFSRAASTEPVPSASSDITSLDSWQSISDELLHEESHTYDNGSIYAGGLPEHISKPLSDLEIEDHFAGFLPPALYSSSCAEGLPHTSNGLEMETLQTLNPCAAADPYSLDSCTQGSDHFISTGFSLSSLLVHAGDPTEMMWPSDEIGAISNTIDTPTLLLIDGVTVPECLSGISASRPDFPNHEASGMTGTTHTWTCSINGCSKVFHQQYKYKYVLRRHLAVVFGLFQALPNTS